MTYRFNPAIKDRVLRLIALITLFVFSIPAAWSRGGGGGGGHGGFGGGGFGGGGFGGGHYYGGGGYYGGPRYYGGYYGGPHYYGGGYYGGYNNGYGYNPVGADIFIAIFWIVVLLLVAVGIAGLWHSRKSLVSITMVLANGKQYTSMLERFTSQSKFDAPQSRTYAAHEIIHLIHDIDILVGSVRVTQAALDGSSLGDQAKFLWQEEMRKGEVKADVINVSSPSGKMKANFGPPKYDPAGADPNDDGYCIFNIIVTASGLWSVSSSMRGDVVNAVHRLASSDIDALYFYYTPSAGTSMRRGDAITLLEQLASR